MCDPKGYGFSAVLVINGVWFLHPPSKQVPAAMILNGGYQIFGQVIDRVGKITDFGHQ